MHDIDRRIARQVKAMTRQELLKKVLAGQISGRQAATILGVSERHLRRLRRRAEQAGLDALVDGRGGRMRRARIPQETVDELLRLRRDLYRDFSIRHFYEFVTEKHGLKLSYTKTRSLVQEAGLAMKGQSRGRHRRRRERRPMLGMMLHLDASMHRWIPGVRNHDLVVMQDDATSRILYARFFKEECVLSTLAALKHVLLRYGRFGELYTDRGSHFCNTRIAKRGPDQVQQGTVPLVLKSLSIRQIWAFSPQARGRGERTFGTMQGRLPQELALAGITNYEDANDYLTQVFIDDYNSRFAVKPAQPESVFTSLAGLDIDLLLSEKHERVVRNDNTVLFEKVVLQLPATTTRSHYVRCTVVVHKFPNEDLGVSYQGMLLGKFGFGGELRTEVKQGKERKVADLGPEPKAVAGPLWQTCPGHL